MSLLLRWVRRVTGSLAARIVLILTLGMIVAVTASLMLSKRLRMQDREQARRAQLVEVVADVTTRLRREPMAMTVQLEARGVPGVRLGKAAMAGEGVPDRAAEAMLRSRLGAVAPLGVTRLRGAACAPAGTPVLAADTGETAGCWNVRLSAADDQALVVDVPLIHVYGDDLLDPTYLAVLLALGLGVAALLTQATLLPLRKLTRAARRFSAAADPVTIPEQGPQEVRTALATFNLMQQRVREGVQERTHILAAVSHDLQTPLTRMRLRLEKVQDAELRERLIADLGEMQRLVHEGLDLAHSSEGREPWSIVDVDSLLSSISEDMAETGARVRFGGGVGVRVKVRLAALTRAVQNLADNAVKYGGEAELRSELGGAQLHIIVQDRGPGLSEAQLKTAFEPFRRLEPTHKRTSSGTGLGLTIARAQAATFGATVTLANRSGGGLRATLATPLHQDT